MAVLIMMIVLTTAVTGGLVAAISGGSLSRLGDGYGGLYGVPALLLMLTSLLMTAPIVIEARRRLPSREHRLRSAIFVVGGLWVVAIGYAQVAHLVDPCVHGWWDARSRVGDQPLCERFGRELNWHTRFHLLAHALPAAVLFGLYATAVRTWDQAGSGGDSGCQVHPQELGDPEEGGRELHRVR